MIESCCERLGKPEFFNRIGANLASGSGVAARADEIATAGRFNPPPEAD
jgi:hypothetical protein